MKRKISFCVLAFVMAIVMAVVSPAQVIATSTNKQYIKEIRIAYGEDGKKQLTDAGYTILCDTSSNIVNANEDGDGEAVYLGYITTSLKEEAITDVAVMPMGSEGDRSYSFEAYEKEMQNLESQIVEKVQNFGAAILEFRNNYSKASPYNDYALRAYTMLNHFTEDDTIREVTVTKEDGTEETTTEPTPLGELFVDNSYVVEAGPTFSKDYKGPEVYRNILMMGNSTAVSAVNDALVLGCTETEGETFLDRISKLHYTRSLNSDYNFARSTLSVIIENFRSILLEAKAVYDEALASEGGKENYIDLFAPEDQAYVLKQLTLVEIMQSIPYADCEDDDGNDLTFLDVMLLPTDYSDDELALDDYMIDILARAMTPGQVAIAQYSGLSPLIFNAYSTKMEPTTDEEGTVNDALSFVDDTIADYEYLEPISVYTGVDRSIFHDSKTVAITSAAIQAQTSDGGFGALPEYTEGNKGYLTMGIIGSAIAVAGTASAIYTGVKLFNKASEYASIPDPAKIVYEFTYYPNEFAYRYKMPVKNTWTETEFAAHVHNQPIYENDGIRAQFGGELYSKRVVPEEAAQIEQKASLYKISTFEKIMLGVEVIAAIAGLVVAVIGFVQYKKSKEIQEVTYDPIPRAIIDVRYKEGDDTGYYFNYYAAKLASTGDEDYKTETDTTKLYGDLNGLNKKDPWLVLYYARDLRLGYPLTTNALFKKTADLNTFQKPSYVPVHSFDSTELDINHTYSAINLNRTNGKANAPTLYLFFQKDKSVNINTSTVIDGTNGIIFNWSSLIFFAVGAAVSGTCVGMISKRKNKRKQPVEA